MKITDVLLEFAPPGGDDREPNEEEILRQLAAQWWSGTEQQMARAQQALEAMGWEIGPDESGDDDAGVYVYRIGDDDGKYTIAFGHSELSLDEAKKKKKSSRSLRGYFFPGYAYYGSGESGEGGGDGGGESINRGVAEDSLKEFAPGGNSASSYYAVTANFVKEFVQQKQEELQDLIDLGWSKQDLAQAGTLQGQAADIAHFEQVRDSFLKGLKPGFDAYLRGDTQMKDQLGAYWMENDLPLNKDWEKIYGEPWGDDGEFDEGIAEGTGNVGNAIKYLYQKIYRAGDDEIEYFYQDSPIFAQYWDEYEGDLDSIIAEVDPGELQVILDELESYVQNANLAEGIGKDMAKLGGIAALGIGAGLGANYIDQQQPRVEVGGQKAYLIQHPGWGRVPDNAMTLQGKDGKTYTVWASKGKGSTQYYATPADNVKEDVAKTGFTKTPSGDYINQHTGVRSSKPPVKKKRGEKTGAEWDAIEKAKKDKDQGVAEGDKKPEPPEADYGDDYQAMVARVKKLAGLGPMKTVYDPKKRVYRNMPTAVQPAQKK